MESIFGLRNNYLFQYWPRRFPILMLFTVKVREGEKIYTVVNPVRISYWINFG